MTKESEIQEAAERCNCILCGGPKDEVFVFQPFPNLMEKFGANPGRHCLVVYGICKACEGLDNYLEMVEAELAKREPADEQCAVSRN